MRRLFLTLTVCTGVLLISATARAGGTDSAAADALFEEGRAAMEAGDVARACEKFDASRRLEPTTGTLLNLGECNARLGRKRAAWVLYREALRVMPDSDDRRSYAQRSLDTLERSLARVSLELDPDIPKDARVLLNGDPIAPPYDAPRIVDAGRVVVRVEAEARPAWETSIVVSAGESAKVRVSTNHAATENNAKSHNGRQALGLVLGGLGVGSLGVGTGFGIAALDASASARDRCGGNLECADPGVLAAARGDASTAQSQATVSSILLGAGVLLVASSVYFLFVSPGGRSGSSTRAEARLRHVF